MTKGPRVYRMGFDALRVCLGSGAKTYQGRELLALVAWSQLGRFAAPEPTSAPAWRLGRVHEAVRRGLRWRPTDPFLDLIRRWDDAAGSDSIANLHDSTTELTALADRYVRLAESPRGGQAPFRIAAAALRAFVAAHLQMKEAFLQAPDVYVDPVTYVNEEGRYPRPAVAVAFTDEPRPGEPRQDWVDGTPADWAPTIDFTTAMDLSFLVSLSDVVFLSERKTRQEGARYWVRRLLDMEPLVLIG